MAEQVANMSTVAEQSQARMLEMMPPSSTSSSDKLLRRIAALLFVLVAGVLTVFGYYASSICITVLLAGFLAILFDPLVVKLEKLHLPRGVAAAGIVLVGMGLIGLLGYALYGRAMSFAEELPVYASTIQQTIEPISRKIQDFQQSAGNLTNGVHPTKKVPEVRLQESPSWPDYLVRGVGSVSGALIIAGVVPFLTFFMLCTRDQMAIRMDGLFSSKGGRVSVHHEPEPDDSRFRSRQPYRRLRDGRSDHAGVTGCWHERRHTSRNRQRALEFAAVPWIDRFACSSFSSGAPSVQHTRTIYCHHSDHSLPACRIREPSHSEIYCQSFEYRAGGGDGWDSLLGLVVGCDGLAARCAAHSIHQAGRGFAPVLMSIVQHAGADTASDSTLGALRRNGFGTGNSLPAPRPEKVPVGRQP
jgi:AI-2E family transporter